VNFVCKSCGIDKPSSEYRIHKRGYRIGKCRECERAYQRAKYAENPDLIRKRKRESMAKSRSESPERHRRQQRDWHARNREQNLKKMREYSGRRFFWTKAMKLRGASRASHKELACLWRSQRGACALTGRKLHRDAQLDHKTPRARGGGDEIENLQWLSPAVNLAKRDLTDSEFIALCREVAQKAVK